jgi:protein transport protein YIF1
LIVAFSFGAKNKFSPEILWNISFRGSLTLLIEVLFIKLGLYLLAGESNSNLSLIEISAFCGYKYTGIVVSLIVSIFFGNLSYLISTFLTSISMSTFLVKAMRRKTLFNGNEMKSDDYKSIRVYFLFVIALLQIPISFWLSFPYAYNYSNI